MKALIALLLLSLSAQADIVHIPLTLKSTVGAPLLIMLHGCKTGAEEFAAGTRMNDLADRYGFVVYYPEQDIKRNSDRCWNWFLPVNQSRTPYAEPDLIMSFAEKLRDQMHLGRMVVAGMSAGAGMAAIIASCYAREIEGVAMHSGISFEAALDMDTANKIIETGPIMNDLSTAMSAFYCSMTPYDFSMPLITFHGTADPRVVPSNQNAVLNHFLWFNDLMDDGMANGSVSHEPASANFTPARGDKYGYLTEDYAIKGGTIRRVLVSDLVHAWSGGDPAYQRNDPRGPDASQMIVDFLKLSDKK